MSIEQVKEFHEAFGHPVETEPTLPSLEVFDLRKRLILEELSETIRDAKLNNLVKYVDGLADLIVVINGSILVFGRNTVIEKLGAYEEDLLYGERTTATPSLPSEEYLDLLEEDVVSLLNILNLHYACDRKVDCVQTLYRLRYEVYSLCQWTGIPIQEVNDVVHKANMSKLGGDGKPIYRESDNKILKGPNFRPPEEDIEAILKAHGAEL